MNCISLSLESYLAEQIERRSQYIWRDVIFLKSTGAIMKQIFGILLLAALTFGASRKGQTKGYMGWGLGGGIALAVPDDGWGFYNWYWGDYWKSDLYYGGCEGVGPGLEAKGIIRFGIGKGGFIHYVPNIGWWGRWEDVNYRYTNESISIHDHDVNINLSDVRYVPPIPNSFPVKPYIGFGLINFNIYSWRGKSDLGKWKHKDTEFQVYQNFITGAEFDTKGNLWPYVEFKF